MLNLMLISFWRVQLFGLVFSCSFSVKPDIEEEMENGEGVELEVNSDCRDVESTHAPTQPCKENREKRVSWKVRGS